MVRKKDNRKQVLTLAKKITQPKEQDRVIGILEKIYDDFRSFGESLALLQEKMERGFADMKREMEGIDKRLMRVEVIVMGLEEDMRDVKAEIQLIRKEMKSDITAEKYNELKRRVEILEEKVGVK